LAYQLRSRNFSTKELDYLTETLTDELGDEVIVRTEEVNARTWDELTTATTSFTSFSIWNKILSGE
jgi:hypothetical protein